jgi:hypothetical protein
VQIKSLIIAGVVITGIQAPAVAQERLADEIAVCARIAKKDARLACFDSVAQAVRQSGPAPVASAPPPPRNALPVPPPPEPKIGAEQVDRRNREAPQAASPNEAQATVTSSRDDGRGLWQFQMADGSIWRMTEGVSGFRPPAANEVVVIRKGALGSYMIKVGRQGAVRATRVR